MSLVTVTPRTDGTVLTAALYNADRQEIVDGLEGILGTKQAPIGTYAALETSSQILSGASYASVASTTVTIPTGGRLLVLGQLTAASGGYLYRFQLAGGTMAYPGDNQVLSVSGTTMVLGWNASPGVGAFNLEWQMRAAVPPQTVTTRLMLAVVI